ncbi:alpha/beta hydrolase [Poseidonibacter sp.]|uniref:alpha/beta hydrolase n=1 Tax=Poseidonibacter sp. TaxID=2321188 RepID=UPI003C763105
MKNKILLLLLVVLFTGCSSIPTVNERIIISNKLIKHLELKKEIIDSEKFKIYTLQKKSKCKNLRIYIEGDGFSWIMKTKISDNPTPINPLSMKLFIKDNSSCKVYLARPCQYVNDILCEKKYWTSHRFSGQIIDSYTETFDKLKRKIGNLSFEIVGYSGGAAIATLISSKRNDIKYIITVAGNLNHKHWTSKKKITPLTHSLNPVNFSYKLEKIKQVHLIGSNDKIIDESNFNSYISYFENTSNIKKIVYKGFSHHNNWEENWNKILLDISKIEY